LKGTVHGRCGRLQELGHLSSREPEDLTEEQDSTLIRRQVLQRHDEGQLHGLALLIARLWVRTRVFDLQWLSIRL
jgi:hypothetical protein